VSWCYSSCYCRVFFSFLLLFHCFYPSCILLISVVPPCLYCLIEDLSIPQLFQANINDSTRQLPTATKREYAHSTSYLPSSARPSHFLFIQRPTQDTSLGSVQEAIRLIAGGLGHFCNLAYFFPLSSQEQEDKTDGFSNTFNRLYFLPRAPSSTSKVNLVYPPASESRQPCIATVLSTA
jgi:hypothetical protein